VYPNLAGMVMGI